MLRTSLRRITVEERKIITYVWKNREAFVKWPTRKLLLWRGETRIDNLKHKYPIPISSKLKKAKVRPNALSNGPAISAYLFAGGERPPRMDSREGWKIHHIYDGKFPAHPSGRTFRAVQHGDHFTQSAGLVAIHPLAEACADEYFWFAWQLRREAFKRFGYDPDGVFSSRTDRMGFKV